MIDNKLKIATRNESILWKYFYHFSEIQTPVPDSSTMENTTGDVMSPPPLPDDPVRGAIGVLSPTSPTTDTEHTTGDCTNKTNFSIFCMNNKFFSFSLKITISTTNPFCNSHITR